jgi:hypothetical protein
MTVGSSLTLSVVSEGMTAEQVEQSLHAEREKVRSYVGWINADIESAKVMLRRELTEKLTAKRSRAASSKALLGSLNIPVKHNSPEQSYEIPVKRKTINLQQVAASLAAEPGIVAVGMRMVLESGDTRGFFVPCSRGDGRGRRNASRGWAGCGLRCVGRVVGRPGGLTQGGAVFGSRMDRDVDHAVESVAGGGEIGHRGGDAVALRCQQLEGLRGSVPGVDAGQQLQDGAAGQAGGEELLDQPDTFDG